jgi:undecaprenyl-diphosphatase
VYILNGHCGGRYGFISSHAANGWALATFVMMLVRKGNIRIAFGMSRRLLFSLLLIFVTLISFSRIYLGVHYPGDILCGAFFGIALSYIFAKIFFRFSYGEN